jgi:hypothetical protein
MKKFTIALVLIAASATGAFAQPRDAGGKNVAAAQEQNREQAVDHAAKAKKRLVNWADAKIACYSAIAGATEGVHWRVNPNNPGDIETHSSLWALPASVTSEFAKCKAKVPGQ